MIGLAPLIPVILRQYGGTNQQLQSSVDLLQSNNLALNATDNETCAALESSIVEFVKGSAFETTIVGQKTLHILSLGVEPVRCDFQMLNDTDDSSTLAAIACQNSAAMKRCEELLPIDSCADLCMGWSRTNETERLRFLEQHYGVRPSVTVPLGTSDMGMYTLPSGELESAAFSVRVLYNEELSVRRT